jgi:hypothetical protein
MSVKLNPRSSLRALSLIALSALAIACGDPDDDGNGLGQMPNPSQAGDSGVVFDTGVPMQQPVLPDSGMNPPRPDSGVMIGPIDAGMLMPPADAGRDAGAPLGDAGAHGDGGASGDGGSCPTYDNFGKMFMMTYCLTCHTGALAQRMVMLDTLAGVQKNKATIKRVAVSSMAMPEANPKPSAAERMKLGQWLDCGPM